MLYRSQDINTKSFTIPMLKFNVYILIFFAFIALLPSCKKPEVFPETPSITFQKITVIDSIDLLDRQIKVGKLSFSFIDGNGDIGLTEADTAAPFDTSKIYLKQYIKKDGVFNEVDTLLNYRLPYMKPQGQNKNLKGDITLDIIYSIIPEDTFYYDFFIIDRANNRSNIEVTPEVFIEGK